MMFGDSSLIFREFIMRKPLDYHGSSSGLTPRLLVFLLAVFLPSCHTVVHPLIEPEQAKLDERLFGAWKCVSSEPGDTSYWYLFVGRSGEASAPPGIMKAIEVHNDKDGNVGHATLYFFQRTLGDVSYANVIDKVPPSPNGFLQWDRSNSKYYLVKYAVDNDRLSVWLMDTDAAESAVSKGELKGTITHRGFLKWSEVQITETSEGLSRFLTGEGNQTLFPEAHKAVFVRMK